MNNLDDLIGKKFIRRSPITGHYIQDIVSRIGCVHSIQYPESVDKGKKFPSTFCKLKYTVFSQKNIPYPFEECMFE